MENQARECRDMASQWLQFGHDVSVMENGTAYVDLEFTFKSFNSAMT